MLLMLCQLMSGKEYMGNIILYCGISTAGYRKEHF